MRRLILYMSMSLDGFVARRDGVIDWLDPCVNGAPRTATTATPRLVFRRGRVNRH
jgi:hypothetical protein